jgi:hypothetical protein
MLSRRNSGSGSASAQSAAPKSSPLRSFAARMGSGKLPPGGGAAASPHSAASAAAGSAAAEETREGPSPLAADGADAGGITYIVGSANSGAAPGDQMPAPEVPSSGGDALAGAMRMLALEQEQAGGLGLQNGRGAAGGSKAGSAASSQSEGSSSRRRAWVPS